MSAKCSKTMFSRASINSTVKKSRPTKWQRAVLTVVTWMARLTPFTLAGAGALIVVLVAAAWLAPAPPGQLQGELANWQAKPAAQERRLLAQARATPPTGRLNLNFERRN